MCLEKRRFDVALQLVSPREIITYLSKLVAYLRDVH